jgi:hypothetical protein
MEISLPAPTITLIDFEELIKAKGLLDVKVKPWVRNRIYHGTGSKVHYKLHHYTRIARQMFADKGESGIYAYFNGSAAIYFGTAFCIQKRVLDHLKESCDVAGHLRYREIFSNFQGWLDLYTLKLGGPDTEGDYLRCIVEKVLIRKYDPILKPIKI